MLGLVSLRDGRVIGGPFPANRRTGSSSACSKQCSLPQRKNALRALVLTGYADAGCDTVTAR